MKVWKNSFNMMSFRKGYIIGSFITAVGWLLSRFTISFGIQEIIDTILGNQTLLNLNLKTLFIIIPFTFVGVFVLGSVMEIILYLFYISAEVLIRKNMMKGLLKKPGAIALPGTTGASISRFRGDVDNVVRLSYRISLRMGFVLYACVVLAYMFYLSWQATSLVFIPFLLIFTIGLVGRRKMDKLRKARRKATSAVTDSLGKIFGSIQTFKVTNTEENIVNYFDQKCQVRRKAIVKEMVFIAILDAIYFFAISAGMGMILLLIGPAMNLGTFTVGNLYFFQTQLWWVGEFFWIIGDMIPVYQQAKVSYERILKIIQNHKDNVSDEEIVKHGPIYEKEDYPAFTSITRGDADHLKLFTAKNVTYHYPGSEKGVTDISLEIPQGSITVVTGRIGSGKTTLLRSLLGLVPNDSGEMYWNGEEITDPTGTMIPPKAAYTPQVPYLFSESLKDNILLNVLSEEGDLDEAVKLAVFEKEIEGFEQGFETLVGPKGVRLSGGQKQRLAAARMFVRKPEILVFDDLSSALDVETEQILWDRLFADGNNQTCLAVSHRPLVLRKADNVIVMKNGKIECQGKLDDLLETNDEMQKLYEGDIAGVNGVHSVRDSVAEQEESK
ncbi:MAG: ABC transporter ATP-binding protein [Candidatus Heimdallarchaeota archaeon]